MSSVCSTVKSVVTSAQIEWTDARWNPGRSETRAGSPIMTSITLL